MTDIQKRLFELQDMAYRDFHSGLIPELPKEHFIGIRVPVLKKFAKEYKKEAEAEVFLKLDILGHDDPTMIRMLQDLIGLDPVKDIPLDSSEVMSLFQNTSALGITPDDIGGCPLGALGVPEFGTDFAMQMLLDTKPKYFSDLVRIAGLAHGTDVWLGNAQTLIQEGKATIQTAICR